MCGTCGCGDDDHITYKNPKNTETNDTPHQHHEHHDHHHHHDNDHAHAHPHTHHKITRQTLSVQHNILSKNDKMAERNRGFFEALNVVAFNLVSSPGSGKTSILEQTIRKKKHEFAYFVIEGDQQTMNDAKRIEAAGAPVIQVNTGNACHLDAVMVNKAAKQLEVKENSLLFIENVGNLVCPALFDLGEHKRVVIISVTEGEDKPAKYPNMFESAHLCLINKIDLLPYVDFDVENFKKIALHINHHLEFIELSAKTGAGFDAWENWILKQKTE